MGKKSAHRKFLFEHGRSRKLSTCLQHSYSINVDKIRERELPCAKIQQSGARRAANLAANTSG